MVGSKFELSAVGLYPIKLVGCGFGPTEVQQNQILEPDSRFPPPRLKRFLTITLIGPTMTAKIYRPTRTAMQSGDAKDKWLLEYEPEAPRQIEPLMGWTSSTDMKSQIKLRFDTKEEAIAYAQRVGVAYRVEEPKEPTRKTISYSDNFKPNRAAPWTH